MKILKQYWSLVLTILLIVILIGIGNNKTNFGGLISSAGKKVAQNTIDYINNNLLSGQTATLENVEEMSGVYKFKLKIDENEYESYVTKDGKILFTSGIEIKPATSTKEATTATTVAKKTCNDLTKENQPLLEAFVVSECPFGLQMQRILSEIVKNIPSLAQYIKVEYMGDITNNKVTSMHGDKEAQENLRQVCIREEQNSKYWDYLSCHIKKGDVDSCLTQAGIDTSKLTACLNDANKGLAYIKKDFDRQNKFNVTGSPTLILNDNSVSEFDFGGRTAEAVKTVLCCGFNNQPSFCSQQLTTEQAATSLSETYASGSSSAGSCN